MTTTLDLADIQGNILQDFGRGFPTARFFFLRLPDDDRGAVAGRAFIIDYYSRITTALPWEPSKNYPRSLVTKRPTIAVNIAFTFYGLVALKLPTRTLARLPHDFIDGMKARAEILGDVKGNRPELWDPIWDKQPHIMIGLNAPMDFTTGQPVAELDQETAYLAKLCSTHGIEILSGHKPDNASYQDASAVTIQDPVKKTFKPLPIEHFGFRDGLGEPFIEGQDVGDGESQSNPIGGGKLVGKDKWAPLATGEFLLGYPDEAQEIADGSVPSEITRNGTFMVYRKLHQNIGAFHAFIAKSAKTYAEIVTGTDLEDAKDFIKAKMVGRWPDGMPLAVAPTIAAWKEFQRLPKAAANHLKLVDFSFSDDPEGIKCPVTSHLRRVNPRDGLNPGVTSTLTNRRRIVRRGLPYGKTIADDTSEHGIIFMAMCANLSRQFEFVQQQWLNYGLDANAGNDTCPLLGNREGDAKFVIPVDPDSGQAPFILSKIPQFVETRGGDYFFLPSMTALRMIGMGVVDPT